METGWRSTPVPRHNLPMQSLEFALVRGQFISDGHFVYPRPFLYRGAEGEPMELPYRGLFVEADGRRILIDTGAGPSGPFCGQLPDNLRQSGINPETIQTVFLTHAHPDHIGGLRTQNGELTFPNAEVILARREWEYWLDLSTNRRFGSGEIFGSPEVEEYAHSWLRKYLFSLSELVTLVGDSFTLAPGVRAFACPGHTPGHMGVEVGGEFVYVADLFTLPEQVEDLGWTMPSDADPGRLVQSRREVLERAAREGLRLAMCHSTETGFVEARGDQFHWIGDQ